MEMAACISRSTILITVNSYRDPARGGDLNAKPPSILMISTPDFAIILSK